MPKYGDAEKQSVLSGESHLSMEMVRDIGKGNMPVTAYLRDDEFRLEDKERAKKPAPRHLRKNCLDAECCRWLDDAIRINGEDSPIQIRTRQLLDRIRLKLLLERLSRSNRAQMVSNYSVMGLVVPVWIAV